MSLFQKEEECNLFCNVCLLLEILTIDIFTVYGWRFSNRLSNDEFILRHLSHFVRLMGVDAKGPFGSQGGQRNFVGLDFLNNVSFPGFWFIGKAKEVFHSIRIL